MYIYAARGGHLEVLQWAREHDCPWNDKTCHAAARGGHLAVLRWAREHNCPWDADECGLDAYIYGHHRVERWVREQIALPAAHPVG